MIRTLCGSLLISLMLLTASGCAMFTPVSVVEGTDDYIELPKGTVIKAVPLNITGKPEVYDITLVKPGAFFSTDAQAEVLQARAKK